MRKSEKIWQVETQGQIYQADFRELKQWIVEGAVLSSDKVKCGDLRWLTLEKVPELNTLFCSENFEFGGLDTFAASGGADSAKINQFLSEPEILTDEPVWDVNGEKICYLHKEAEAVYACLICKKLLCKTCPNSYGGKVKLCPLCGSLCVPADERFKECKSIGTINKPYNESVNSSKDTKIQNRYKFRLLDSIKTFCASLLITKFYFSNLNSSVSSRFTKRLR